MRGQAFWHSTRSIIPLRSSILQNEISEIGKIKPFVREVDLNADNKRFWLGQLTKIDNSKNCSVPLSANHFPL